MRNLVNQVYRSDPEAAFAWATTINKDRDRENSARRAIAEMKEDGKVGEARQAIRGSTLEDAEKNKLLEILD